MTNCVTSQTALALNAAGFEQPEPFFGQYWYNMRELIVIGGQFDPRPLRVFSENRQGEFDPLFISAFLLFAPTATHILAAIPGATLGLEIGGQWVCRWPITEFHFDARYDDCPHEASAKAYLAWKTQTN